MEENACGLGDIHAEYYYIGMHADLRKMNGLVERYARCDEAASVRDVMKEYCGLLMETSLDRYAPILYNDK